MRLTLSVRTLSLGAILVGLGLLGYMLLASETDEERIREQLDLLASAVSIRPDENLVFRKLRLDRQFTDLFADAVRFRVDELSRRISDRKQLAALGGQVQVYFRTGDVSWRGVSIAVHEPTSTADVDATAVLAATRARSALSREERRVTLEFEKLDGDWKIVRGSVARAVED